MLLTVEGDNHPDETGPSVTAFLDGAVTYFRHLGRVY